MCRNVHTSNEPKKLTYTGYLDSFTLSFDGFSNLVSAAMGLLVKQNEVDQVKIVLNYLCIRCTEERASCQRIRWIFGAGLGIVLLCFVLLAALHKPLDHRSSSLIPRSVRLLLRFLLAIAFMLLPLTEDFNSLKTLAVYAGCLTFLTIFETIGKLGTIADPRKVAKALSIPNHEGESAVSELRKRFGPEACGELKEVDLGLNENERGEDDTGIEADLGELVVKKVGLRQRVAYAF